MCDIWKGAGEPRQLTAGDVAGLVESLDRLHTRWVVLSGGEPLLNPSVFELCEVLRRAGIAKITLLTTGQQLAPNALRVADAVDEVVVSLDGSEPVHDAIRRVEGAYRRLAEGVAAVKARAPDLPVTGRCVIQRLNFAVWPETVAAARDLALDRVSFLAADLTSEAFNRSRPWGDRRRSQVAPSAEQLGELEAALESVITRCRADLDSGFIVESIPKRQRLVSYYAAHHGQGMFPPVECNAPWVSAVVEADGTVRPCFFHPAYGELEGSRFERLVNKPEAIRFRRELDVASDPICRRCVCSLNLPPGEPI